MALRGQCKSENNGKRDRSARIATTACTRSDSLSGDAFGERGWTREQGPFQGEKVYVRHSLWRMTLEETPRGTSGD